MIGGALPAVEEACRTHVMNRPAKSSKQDSAPPAFGSVPPQKKKRR